MDSHPFVRRETAPFERCADCGHMAISRLHPHQYIPVAAIPGVCRCGGIKEHPVHFSEQEKELVPA